MPWLLTDILSSLPVFALVLFRLAGLFLTAPIYRSTMIPMRIRAALAAVIAVLVFPLVRADIPADVTLVMAVVGGVGEMMIGATIGLGIAILALGAELAGMMIGTCFQPCSESCRWYARGQSLSKTYAEFLLPALLRSVRE